MKVHGIPNCATVKAARGWLDAHGVAYEFVDFKKTPPGLAQLRRWATAAGWERLLNRRGTTWRQLPESLRRSVVDAESAIEVMRAHASAIKRPVVETDGDGVLVGFDEDTYRRLVAREHG